MSWLRLEITPDLEDVKSRVRARKRDEVKGLSEALLEEAQGLIRPKVVYDFYNIKEINRDRIVFEGDWALQWEAQSPCFSFKGIRKAALLAGTIGPYLEKRVEELFRGRKPLEAFLLDEIGSAAVEVLLDKALEFIDLIAREEGFRAGTPMSPGMLGLPMEVQKEIVIRLPVKEIGLSITTGGMLVPRKSFTTLIGIGENLVKVDKKEICKICRLHNRCPYRKDGR